MTFSAIMDTLVGGGALLTGLLLLLVNPARLLLLTALAFMGVAWAFLS
jgi:hypothetical protein